MAEEPLPARDVSFMSRYPEVFGPGPWHDQPTPIRYGLGIADGWMPLLDRLCEDLVRIIRKDRLTRFRVVQVKEKFGSLRVHAKGGNRRTRDIIDAADRESSGMCERCGSHGKTVNEEDWWRTLCKCCQGESKR